MSGVTAQSRRWFWVLLLVLLGMDPRSSHGGDAGVLSLLRREGQVDERVSMILGQAMVAVEGWGPEQEAFDGLVRAANQGDGLAALNLVVLYQTGGKFAKDPGKAFYWLQKITSGAIVAGLSRELAAWARLKMGMAYLNGEGVAVDPEKARYWLLEAANMDAAYAEYVLGQLDAPEGGAASGSSVQNWTRRAASRGFTPARATLKQMP
ncbi:MAG: sel1 repeat family protein [Magnetococcales bacterium]|nr:sel1 repeat family protein [Magnetococcales bacterium]